MFSWYKYRNKSSVHFLMYLWNISPCSLLTCPRPIGKIQVLMYEVQLERHLETHSLIWFKEVFDTNFIIKNMIIPQEYEHTQLKLNQAWFWLLLRVTSNCSNWKISRIWSPPKTRKFSLLNISLMKYWKHFDLHYANTLTNIFIKSIRTCKIGSKILFCATRGL